MSNPQETFLELLVAAMNDAALEGELTQLQTQLIPPGRKKFEVVRIIIVPEKMQWTFPTVAPAGTPIEGN